MTDFADDAPSIERKRTAAQTNQQINDFVMRQLMASMPGRRWLWLKLTETHIFENITFFEGVDSVRKTYFAAGERNVGLKLLSDVMRLCPREYILAMEENTKKDTTNGRRNPPSASAGESDPDAGDTTSDPSS